MKFTKYFFLLAICLTALSAIAAEEAPAQRLWYVHQEIVKPSMLAQYDASAKDFNALVKEHAAKMPHFNITGAFQHDEMMFTFSIPISSLADVDAIQREFVAMAQEGGEKATQVMQRGSAATEQMKEWIIVEPLALGYVPAQPRLKHEEMKYFHYDMYYVQVGKEMEADALAADFVKLFKTKNIPDPFRVFKVLVGEDLSLYTVQIPAKDPADYATEEVKNQEILGKEGEMLNARALALCRKITTSNAWFRPDLTTAKPKM